MYEEKHQGGRLDGVDILRGLSILAVILLHVQLRMRFAGHTLEAAMPKWLFHLLFWNGNNGVQVFFAISGFLVMVVSVSRGFRGGAGSATLRWMGRHSYEIYLTHEFVVIGATDVYRSWRAGPLWVWFVAVVVVVSAMLGGVVARWFSEPLNRRLRPGGLR